LFALLVGGAGWQPRTHLFSARLCERDRAAKNGARPRGLREENRRLPRPDASLRRGRPRRRTHAQHARSGAALAGSFGGFSPPVAGIRPTVPRCRRREGFRDENPRLEGRAVSRIPPRRLHQPGGNEKEQPAERGAPARDGKVFRPLLAVWRSLSAETTERRVEDSSLQ